MAGRPNREAKNDDYIEEDFDSLFAKEMERQTREGSEGMEKYQFKDPVNDEEESPLIDLDSLLERKKKMEEVELMTEQEIGQAVELVKRHGNLDELQRTIIERIKQETNLFHDLEEIGMLENILNNDLATANSVGGVKVKWAAEVRSKGVYDILSNRAKLKYDAPPSADIVVKSLATEGALPNSLRTLAHEIVHSRQFYDEPGNLKSMAIDSWRNYFNLRPATELMEVHANRQGNDPASQKSKRELIEKIETKKGKDGRKMYKAERDKLIYAVQAIDQLNALGFKPVEIGEIIRKVRNIWHAGWDKERAVYPVAQKMIEERCQELGLGEQDLEDLVMADKLEREIDRLRAKHIAQEEVNKAYLQYKIRDL